MARQRDEQTRRGILGSAIEVFGREGFRSTTIRQIAGRLGIAAGSIYTYFPSKEALFRAAVREGWERFLAELDGIVSAPRRLRERLDGILDYCFQTLRRALPLLRGMLFEARQRRLLEENLDRLCRLLEGLIREGARQGLFRIPGDDDYLRAQVRIHVFGVLSSVALAQDEHLEAEISRVAGAVKRLLYVRLAGPSGPAEGSP
jgi:AcrR family transcriptional regulator